MDRIAPEGSRGSLTAIRANITLGVKNGIKEEIQKTLAVSGSLASLNMMRSMVESPCLRQVSDAVVGRLEICICQYDYPSGIGDDDVHDHPDDRRFSCAVGAY